MAIARLTPRTHTRYGTDLACRYRVEGVFQWEEGELVNLSKGGVCLKCKAPPEREAAVEIEVVLFTEDGTWKKRRMRAVVIWRRGVRAGLRFKSAAKVVQKK